VSGVYRKEWRDVSEVYGYEETISSTAFKVLGACIPKSKEAKPLKNLPATISISKELSYSFCECLHF
jgi:hypothetical protein